MESAQKLHVGQTVTVDGKIAHIAWCWAYDRYSIRFGTPGKWQGEIIVNRNDIEARREVTTMDRATMIERANEAAAEVFAQWRGVEIDWTDQDSVREELDAHWSGAEPANLDAEWTGIDENNFREHVAKALRRLHAQV